VKNETDKALAEALNAECDAAEAKFLAAIAPHRAEFDAAIVAAETKYIAKLVAVGADDYIPCSATRGKEGAP